MDPKDPSLEYEWFDVGMLDYDSETQLYLVQKTDLNNRILDGEGKAVINGGKNADGMSGRHFLPSSSSQTFSLYSITYIVIIRSSYEVLFTLKGCPKALIILSTGIQSYV